jgi:hypothetical protein
MRSFRCGEPPYRTGAWPALVVSGEEHRRLGDRETYRCNYISTYRIFFKPSIMPEKRRCGTKKVEEVPLLSMENQKKKTKRIRGYSFSRIP